MDELTKEELNNIAIKAVGKVALLIDRFGKENNCFVTLNGGVYVENISSASEKNPIEIQNYAEYVWKIVLKGNHI